MFLPLDPDSVGPWTLNFLGLGFSAWKTRAADTHGPFGPDVALQYFRVLCTWACASASDSRCSGGAVTCGLWAVAVLSQAHWMGAPGLLPGLGERRHGWPRLAVPVGDLKHQPTDGQWLPSPAVCGGGCSHLQMLGGTFQTRGPGGRSEEGDRLASPWDGTSLLCQSSDPARGAELRALRHLPLEQFHALDGKLRLCFSTQEALAASAFPLSGEALTRGARL